MLSVVQERMLKEMQEMFQAMNACSDQLLVNRGPKEKAQLIEMGLYDLCPS